MPWILCFVCHTPQFFYIVNEGTKQYVWCEGRASHYKGWSEINKK